MPRSRAGGRRGRRAGSRGRRGSARAASGRRRDHDPESRPALLQRGPATLLRLTRRRRPYPALVEPRGIEPLTSAVRLQRSPFLRLWLSRERSLILNCLRSVRSFDELINCPSGSPQSMSRSDRSVTAEPTLAHQNPNQGIEYGGRRGLPRACEPGESDPENFSKKSAVKPEINGQKQKSDSLRKKSEIKNIHWNLRKIHHGGLKWFKGHLKSTPSTITLISSYVRQYCCCFDPK